MQASREPPARAAPDGPPGRGSLLLSRGRRGFIQGGSAAGRWPTRKTRARNLGQTDWARLVAMTEAAPERAIADAPDWEGIPEDCYKHAIPWTPPGKRLLSLRLDADLLQWFRDGGPGHQTGMNAVLHRFMPAPHRKAPRKPPRLTRPPPPRISPCARRPDGRCRRRTVEESPGSTGIRCRPTAGGGDPRDSATENKPPAQGPQGAPRARAKRCGKSAPRPWQQGRQGKPHREQDRIGTVAAVRVQGHSRLAVRVGRVRRVVRRVPEEWSSRARTARTEPGLQAVWHFLRPGFL